MPKHLLITILIIVTSSSLTLAETGFDDQDNINDPTVNERANACYEGGSMAGKCDSQVEWDAGWFLIRYELGLLTREEIPAGFIWVLPPEVVPESLAIVSVVPNTCIMVGAGSYMDFSSGNFLTGFIPIYDDANCTTTSRVESSNAFVYAADLASANTICINNGQPGVGGANGDAFWCN